MAKLSILFILAALFMSQGVFAQKEGFRINASVDDCENGDTVYLCKMEGFFNMIPLDSTYVSNHAFGFTGSIEGADLRFVCMMHSGKTKHLSSVVLENADFQLDIKDGKETIIGGPSTALYKEFEEGTEAAYGSNSIELRKIATDTTKTVAEREAANTELDKIHKRVVDYKYSFVLNHIPSNISDMLLPYLYNEVSEEQLNDILKRMESVDSKLPNYQGILAERATAKATAIGSVYTDLAGTSPEGNVVKVSDYIQSNAYTMIDFWASWCGPCLKEMPWVVKAYEAYHDKGFEIIGVSLDNNKDSWLKAISRFNMPWPHMCDLKGWDSSAAKTYNIKAIPANVLIDKEGRIVAKDLREQELLDTLEKLLK